MAEPMPAEEQLSLGDIIVKVRKLESFVKRAEKRLAAHEKKLAKLRRELKKEISVLKGRVTA